MLSAKFKRRLILSSMDLFFLLSYFFIPGKIKFLLLKKIRKKIKVTSIGWYMIIGRSSKYKITA